jgi:hypothetical protein
MSKEMFDFGGAIVKAILRLRLHRFRRRRLGRPHHLDHYHRRRLLHQALPRLGLLLRRSRCHYRPCFRLHLATHPRTLLSVSVPYLVGKK